jgi:hypothetical protein
VKLSGAWKRWPEVVLPATRSSISKPMTVGSSVSGPKVQMIDCSGRTHLSEPGFAEAGPQRIDLGQEKPRMMPASHRR